VTAGGNDFESEANRTLRLPNYSHAAQFHIVSSENTTVITSISCRSASSLPVLGN